MNSVKVSVVQAAPVAFERRATLDKVEVLAQKAAATGSRLIVFPEAFLSGYPKGLDFGARVGLRRPQGRQDFQQYWQGAVEVPGAETKRLAEIAAGSRVYLVIGAIEKDGGTLYCTVLFFAPDGGLLGKHRKLMPTASERLIWGYGDGSTLPVFDTPHGKLGAVICWENYMPLMRTAMYAKGIELYCAPTVDDREVWHASMRHIALEGRCFVLSACQYARREDYPSAYALDEEKRPEEAIIRGGSCIVSPLGQVLAGPVYDEEAILSVELDLGEISRGKFDFDATGHYARPDVFQLHVDETQRTPVRFTGGVGNLEQAEPAVEHDPN